MKNEKIVVTKINPIKGIHLKRREKEQEKNMVTLLKLFY